MEEYRDIIMSSPLTAGLNNSDWDFIKDFYHLEAVRYSKNEFLNTLYEPLPWFGLVISGTIQVCRDDYYGNKNIMANVTPGNYFGESLFLTQYATNVYIIAVKESKVIWFRPERLDISADCPEKRAYILLRNLTHMLAKRALALNDRIQALTKPTLREKLIAFFSEYAKDGEREFTVPFDRENMAVYLGVNRSALSRELSKMKADGLITYRKNKFTITAENNN